MKEFNLDIITPYKLAYSASVKAVTVPGTNGEFEVLFNHAPLLSTFEIGRIKVQVDDNNIIIFATSGGTIEVLQNKVLILANSLEKPDEIDVERAKNSEERARNRLSQTDKSKIDVTRAEISLTRALNRLKVANIK